MNLIFSLFLICNWLLFGQASRIINVYVSDLFGDGWHGEFLNITSLDLHIDQRLSPNFSEKMPSKSFNIISDATFVFQPSTFSSSSNVGNFWEMVWAVQIDSQRYFGTYNSYLSLQYNSDTDLFVIIHQTNLIEIDNAIPAVPVIAALSKESCTNIFIGTQIKSARKMTYIPSTVMDDLLVALDFPYWTISDYHSRASVYAHSAYSSDWHSDVVCLEDGVYDFRTTGYQYESSKQGHWDFCGVSGMPYEEVLFQISDGKCSVVSNNTHKYNNIDYAAATSNLEDPVVSTVNLDMTYYHHDYNIKHPPIFIPLQTLENSINTPAQASTFTTVTITSLSDTSTSYASDCDPTTSNANCNLRSAFKYCQSISVKCIIDIPFNFTIILQYGSISVSSTTNDIILEGHQSLISASDNHNDRFLKLNGCKNIEIRDLTIKKFGTAQSLQGGVIYATKLSSLTISNVIFNQNCGYKGGAIYM
jgi:hypothetical protein